MLEKSNFPDASAVAEGAAAFANSTVTSALVANFLTDCFRVDASKDVVRSIPVDKVDI